MNNNMNGINMNMNMPNQINMMNFMNNNFMYPHLMQINQMNQMMLKMKNNQNFEINSQSSNEKLTQIVGLETVVAINPCKHKYTDEIYQKITEICINAIKDKNIDRKDIAIYCAEKIKEKLKGQWFVLIQNEKDQNFDFRFSLINFYDMIIFKYRENYIYVSQLFKK